MEKDPVPTDDPKANDWNSNEDELEQLSDEAFELALMETGEDAPFDISYRPGRVLFYSRPRQRQKWGDTQVLPRVNWGDLFFDLFYVAATYNVSNILTNQPSGEGLLFAAGTFWPVMGFWIEKVMYDARYVHEDDLVHRFAEVASLVILATTVLHIRVVSIMSDASGEVSMFVFALMLVVERFFAMFRYLEVYLMGIGQPAMKNSALHVMRSLSVSLPFYMAATIVAGLEFYGSGAGSRRLAAAVGVENVTYEPNAPNRIPIVLCLAGYIGYQLITTVQIVCWFPRGGRHKDVSVPLNVDFTLHRNGEWTMLMLGESVFSLLTVEVPYESSGFLTTFYCGVITVILLQYLHFRSQPQTADFHALRRHKDAGIGWHLIQHLYSFVLVALGAAFTFFLTDFAGAGGTGRLLEERWLSGSGQPAYDPEALRERAAILFSGSLAIVFFCLDTMTLLHLGIKESHNRCICKETKVKNVKGIILVFLRLGLLAFTATLSLWVTDPTYLSMIGLVCVLLQLMFRKLGWKYLSHEQAQHLTHLEVDDKDDDGSSRWPNVTHARAMAGDATEQISLNET